MKFSRKKVLALPVTLHRKSIYILPTRHGFLFLVVLLAMLAGSINYNNNLGFLLVFLLGGMALVSLFHTHRNLSGLRLLSVSAEPVWAGQAAVFRFRVWPGPFSRRAIVLKLPQNPAANPADIALGKEARLSVRATAPKRGLFQPGPVTVTTRYPLGLFYAWSVLQLDELSCLVYPRPLAGPFDRHVQPLGQEGQEGTGTGPGADDFWGLTPYQPGDSVRHISWKAFSRGQGLFVKTFGGGRRRVAVFDYAALDLRDVEAQLSRLCDLVLTAANRDMRYGLRLPDAFIPPDAGESHKYRCLKALALFGVEGESK